MNKKNISALLGDYYSNKLELFLGSINQSNINDTDRDGRTLLHTIVGDDNVEVASKLISLGVDVNKEDNSGWTSLHFAAQNYNIDMVKLLVKSGANVNALDGNGNSILSRAVFNSKGKLEVIEFLIKEGANPDIENTSGVSARKLAKTISNFDVSYLFE